MATPSPQRDVTLTLSSGPPQPLDLDALARQYGGQPDLDALARQFGGTAEAEPAAADPPSWLDLAGAVAGGLKDGLVPIDTLRAMYDATSGAFTKANAAAKRGDVGEWLGQSATAAAAPVATLAGGLARAQWMPFQKAAHAFKLGRYSEAAGYTAAGLVPLMGPLAAGIGEELGTGDPLTMAHGVGLGLSMPLPAAAAKGIQAIRARGGLPITPALRGPANPTEAAAVQYGVDKGIPLPGSVVSGNRAVGMVEAAVDHSLPGSVIAKEAHEATARGLTAEARALAERARPGPPVTMNQAGRGVAGALERRVDRLTGVQGQSYDQFRAVEADPANARDVPTGAPEPVPPPDTFQGRTGTVEDVYEAVLADARAQGYKGQADTLREKFQRKVTEAIDNRIGLAEAGEDAGGGYAPEELLREVAANGGISLKLESKHAGAQGGEVRRLMETDEARSGTYGGVRGVFVKGAGERRAGARAKKGINYAAYGEAGEKFAERAARSVPPKTLDHMAEALRQDPRFAHLAGPNELMDAIEAAGDQIRHRTEYARRYGEIDGGSVGADLAQVGVVPGSKWWDEAWLDPDAFAGEGEPTIATERMALPVELADAKAALRPLEAELARTMPLTQAEASPGLRAIRNVLAMRDHAPASVVDADLSTIKGIVRERGTTPKARYLARQAQDALERALGATLAAVPEAEAALARGRRATVAKYETKEVGAKLFPPRGSPVKTIKALLAPGDSAIADLQAVKRLAPQEIPKIARANLERLFNHSTREGSYTRADLPWKVWTELGPETKAILYKPAHVADLDRFFLLAKKVGLDPNPSGTGKMIVAMRVLEQSVVLAVSNPAGSVVYNLVPYQIAKLLHSPAGVRALMRGLRIPVSNKLAAAAVSSQIMAIAGDPAHKDK